MERLEAVQRCILFNVSLWRKVQYNLLTDFEINYTDPLVMPAGKEAGCRVAAVSPDYLPNRKIHQMFSIESFIQDSHRYFSLLSLMSRVAAPGYIKGTTTIN